MMLHIDGSHHQWFQDERWHDLIVILDDATSEIYYAQLAHQETTAKGCSVRCIRTVGPISGSRPRAGARSIMSVPRKWAVR
jgi:hypothetical protein